MTKIPVYLKTDLTYRVVVYNLLMMPNIVRKKSKPGIFSFTVENDPVFTGVLIQVTSKGKLNIYIPEDAPEDEIVEKTLKLVSVANQAPIKILQRKRANAQKLEQHPMPGLNMEITQRIVGHPHVKRQLPKVGFNMYNPNDYPIRVKVELRTILGGRNLGLVQGTKGYYSGETEINLNPMGKPPLIKGLINGNFTIQKECACSTEELTIEIRATIIDQDNREHQPLPESWTYMREKNAWFYEPRTFTNGT